MTRSVYIALFLIASFFFHTHLFSQEGENGNSDFVFDISTLPPILISEAGQEIRTQTAWEEQRRPEILKLLEEMEYGKHPDVHFTLVTSVLEESNDALSGKAKRKQIELKIYNESRSDSLITVMLLYTPINAAKSPVFLGLNFGGNHTLSNDAGVFINSGWVSSRQKGAVDNRATELSIGSASSRWPLEFLLESGYGLASIYCGDFDPDFHDEFKNGLHGLLESDAGTVRKGDAWGTISAWAFGLSRAMDYLESDSDIDSENVIVIGHSRLGKTALWAGAADQRFAMSISNESGCGGAALSKRRYGETVKRINTHFPHWFCNNFKRFNDNEDALPFDQHMLIALMAPRPVYIASAIEDQHADPEGEFLSGMLACEVYGLYGLPCELPSEMPGLNMPLLKGYIGYHIREGRHDIKLYDWEQYVKFADGFMNY